MSARTATQIQPAAAFQTGLEQVWTQAAAALPGSDWMKQIRRDALARVVRDGLPGRRHEQWRYADLAAMRTTALPLAPALGRPAKDHGAEISTPTHGVEIINGRVTALPEPASLPDGFEVLRLADALDIPSLWLRPFLEPGADSINNLNLAFATDGVLVRVGRGIAVSRPLLVRNSTSLSGNMAHDRSAVVLEENASLTLIEVAHGDGTRDSLATSRLTIQLERGARLIHVCLTDGTAGMAAIRDGQVDIAEGARYEQVALASGSGLSRQQLHVCLQGNGAYCDLATAYAAPAGRQVDLSVALHHAAPGTISRYLAKGIAARKGRGVVQGRVIVDQLAQGTDSHQMARGLLLEEGAEIFHKPELEIYADDVKCGHGATIASLDPNQMFYLQSRGVPPAEARDMLLAAFVRDVSDRAPDILREDLEAWAARHLLQKEATP
jgi:Fe-S cluster assembly protein SufD